VVYFPAGTYMVKSVISVPTGTVLRGQRASATTLKFEMLGHCINIAGTTAGSFQAVTSGYTVHSSSIGVTDGSQFQVGDFAEMHQDNDPAWSPSSWSKFGQMVRITNVAGNTLTLEHPLRITYQEGLNPTIRKVSMVKDAGVENLKVERVKIGTEDDRDNRFTIRLYFAANCWVRGVECYNGWGGHIGLVYSTQCDVTGCYIHHAADYDGGGSGYGTRLEYKTGECLIEDNIYQTLRHAMLLQATVNGNVHGYNYSRENYWDNGWIDPDDLTGDISCHGNYVYANLFEGNIVQHIWLDDSHGLNGPYNTFFRNRGELRGLNCSSSQTLGQNYVGNEAFENNYWLGRPGDGYSPRGSDNFEHGNNTESDGLQAPGTGTLDDYSYYLNANPTSAPPTPAFWDIADTIPTIGPPHLLSTMKTNPAYARWFSGAVKTVGPPSIARQPTNLTVNAGQSASFSIEAYGTPAAQYVWHKAGAALPGETNATFTIAGASPADAGDYCVAVSDDDGTVTSSVATLTVVPSSAPRSPATLFVISCILPPLPAATEAP